ncbi:hypothetical protein [Hafnia psychrotolerans]|uniref:hypothetical protein n=1 Tax=Hafnia psychrotolerans TaxID=1477018 RepID=UPI00166A6C78|nr:hypothetical protein [Hafnia psychrotolerans]
MHTKICFKCKADKTLSAFYRHARMADGHLNKCKECTKLDNAANRRINFHHYQNYDQQRDQNIERIELKKAYRQSTKGKIVVAACHQRYQEKFPAKRKAHLLVGNFLRAGKLVRPETCESCSTVKQLQAHHCDYTKPLDVMWLCSSCHTDWHRHNTPVYGEPVITEAARPGVSAGNEKIR